MRQSPGILTSPHPGALLNISHPLSLDAGRRCRAQVQAHREPGVKPWKLHLAVGALALSLSPC